MKQYRFLSFLLPPSRANSASFADIVDPVWKARCNGPTARAIREMHVDNPVWRVLHRVTHVERVPPPIASRPVYTAATDLADPVNLEGNSALFRMVASRITTLTPTRADVGAAVGAVLNPARTAPGVYPVSVLEGMLPWWRTFLDTAQPMPARTPEPAATALLAILVRRIVGYVSAGYATNRLPLPTP